MRIHPYKVYIFLIRITSRVDLAMSVCPYEGGDLGLGFLRTQKRLLR